MTYGDGVWPASFVKFVNIIRCLSISVRVFLTFLPAVLRLISPAARSNGVALVPAHIATPPCRDLAVGAALLSRPLSLVSHSDLVCIKTGRPRGVSWVVKVGMC